MYMFFALKDGPGMVTSCQEAWSTGGTSWFVDLTTSDPLYILPAANAVSTFTSIYFIKGEGDAQETMKKFAAPLSIFLGAISTTMPAGVLVYWLTNNACTMGINELFKLPIVDKELKKEMKFLQPKKEKVVEFDPIMKAKALLKKQGKSTKNEVVFKVNKKKNKNRKKKNGKNSDGNRTSSTDVVTP